MKLTRAPRLLRDSCCEVVSFQAGSVFGVARVRGTVLGRGTTMMYLPLTFFEEKRSLKPFTALLVTKRVAIATHCTFQFKNLIVWWALEIAAIAVRVVPLGANICAVCESTTARVEFVLLLMKEAAILCTSIVDVL